MKRYSFLLLILLGAALLSGCMAEKALPEAAYTYAAESVENLGGASEVTWISAHGSEIYLSLMETELSEVDGFEQNLPVSSSFIKYSAESGQLQPLSYRGEAYERMAVSPGGEFWVLGNNELLKLDSEFKVTDSFELPATTQTPWSSPVFDAEGNLYLYTHESIGGKVVAFDLSSGKPEPLFSLNTTGRIMGMSATDGNVAVKYSNADGDYLRLINSSLKDWGKSVTLDRQLSLVQGTDLGLFLQNEIGVLALDIETGELTEVFNWVYCGLHGWNLLVPLQDGSFLAQRGSIYMGEETSLERIKPVEIDSPPVVLRLASDNGSSFQKMLSDFNRERDDVKIELLDYSVYRTGISSDGVVGLNYSGLVRLIADLTAGKSIDIIDLSSISVEKYVKSGKLEDLNPYIETDPELNREDFFENILSAMEIDGGLYEITPRVSILSMLADPELAGSEPGWTIDEMRACVAAGADRPGGPLPFINTSHFILDTFLQFYMEDLIDWTAGTVDFNAEEFLFALELAELYPMEHDYENLPEDEEVMRGYLASFYSVSAPYDTIDVRESFTAVKGLPIDEGVGNAAIGTVSIGLMSASANKDLAWEFVRRFLLPDGPEFGFGSIGFSINKERFQHDLETGSGRIYSREEMDLYGLTYMGGEESELGDWSRELLLSVSRVARKDASIQSIVQEETTAYFAGDKTLDETIRNIESRIRLYIAE